MGSGAHAGLNEGKGPQYRSFVSRLSRLSSNKGLTGTEPWAKTLEVLGGFVHDPGLCAGVDERPEPRWPA